MKTIALLLLTQQLSLGAAADTIFRQWNSTSTPGCAVGVSRDWQVLLKRGYGMANLETGTPITATTILESGSVAKQFTATAVMLLVRDGKLSLDDPVRKYIPELPEYDKPITIRHLLTHTSGLREWSSLVAHQGWPRGQRAHRQGDLLDIVVRQKALNYPVGDFYSYTNSGFGLLVTVIERVSGVSFSEFSRTRIFEPLGMTHTQWRNDFTRVVPGRAQAYNRVQSVWRLAMPFEDVVGPGGMLTTVGDWLIWNDALAKKTLGSEIVDSLTRRMRLNSGREITYARGLMIQDYRGVSEVAHSGSTGGYSTYLARYPDRENLSIAVMCNGANTNPTLYTHQLADRLITDFPPQPALDTTPVDSAAFTRYVGVYRSKRNHAMLQVGTDAGPRFRALPDGSFLLLNNGTRWRFELNPAGVPVGLRVSQPDGDTVAYWYAAPSTWRPTLQELEALTGSYRSDELGVTWVAKVANDTLMLTARPGEARRLVPAYPDGFSFGGTAVWFTHDARGRVTAMHFSEARVWDLVLPKVPAPR